MRIVIAEKNQTGRRLLAQLLRMEGHDVFLIEEGGDAMGLINHHRPEMVVMNMFNAPRSEGPSLGQAGVGEEGCHAPVLMMTSMNTCEKMYIFMGKGGSHEVDAFDRLPANTKIGTMDHVQRICEMLDRNLRTSVRTAAGRFPMGTPAQGLLDIYV